MLVPELPSRVYCIIDADRTGPDAVGLVRTALQAGVGMILLRTPGLTTRQALETGGALVGMTRAARTPLIMDARVDVCLALGADGVHVESEDMPVAHARRLLGPAAIIGATAATAHDAGIAQEDGATYVLADAGGTLATAASPKPDLEQLRRVTMSTALPACVFTHVTPESLEALACEGAQFICVCCATDAGDNPARGLREAVELVGTYFKPRHIAP